MSYEMKKRVIGIENPTFQARKENSDDVGIDQAPDFRFAFPKGLLCAFELLNIQVHPDPQQQASIARPERFGATEEPAVASLSVTNSKTKFTGLARAYIDWPGFACPLLVVRMQKRDMGVPLCANVDAET